MTKILKKADNEPRLNQVRVIMSETMEKDTKVLFKTIMKAMTQKRVEPKEQHKFLAEYFRAVEDEVGYDKLMEFFHSWVRLQREQVK